MSPRKKRATCDYMVHLRYSDLLHTEIEASMFHRHLPVFCPALLVCTPASGTLAPIQ